MTPETDNAIRAACRRCTEEIKQAMRKKAKAELERHSDANHPETPPANCTSGS